MIPTENPDQNEIDLGTIFHRTLNDYCQETNHPKPPTQILMRGGRWIRSIMGETNEETLLGINVYCRKRIVALSKQVEEFKDKKMMQ